MKTIGKLQKEFIGSYTSCIGRLDKGIRYAISKYNPHNLRCFGKITNFPMANASAVVVQRTSLVDIFKKIWIDRMKRTRELPLNLGRLILDGYVPYVQEYPVLRCDPAHPENVRGQHCVSTVQIVIRM